MRRIEQVRGWMVGVACAALLLAPPVRAAEPSATPPSKSAAKPAATLPPKSADVPAAPSAEVQAQTEAFWRPAMAYLKTAHVQSTAVANAMANINDGITTLNDVKAMLLKARFVENAGFHGEYQSKVSGEAPPDLAPVLAAADEVHALFDSSTVEMLGYWEGEGRQSKLESGFGHFREMVIKLNAAIDLGNAWAKQHSAR